MNLVVPYGSDDGEGNHRKYSQGIVIMNDKTKCIGCEDNFYNGNNPYGVQECWHLKDAKLVKRIRVGVWQNPPYSIDKPVEVFACRTEKGNVLVKPEELTKEGFWKS